MKKNYSLNSSDTSARLDSVEPINFRSTLNLPNPDFTIPMRAHLPELEKRIQAGWASIGKRGLYHEIQDLRAKQESPVFVLLDGPPYTNGPIHMGTAMNKALKDFVMKSRTMMGYRTPFIPGFDNHGLPIEQAVLKGFVERGESPDVLTLRGACREHAKRHISVQIEQFKRLGVLAHWDEPYTTMSYQFEAGIVRIFKKVVDGGFVYRGLRPTLWSPSCRTALADNEIVHLDYVSRAVHALFPLQSDPEGLLRGFENVFAVIWTTTPWTIPANVALAVGSELDYAVVRIEKNAERREWSVAHYIIASNLVDEVVSKIGWTEFDIVAVVPGSKLESLIFKHPLLDRHSPIITAEYVSSDSGTGVVHTAPGHGPEDFESGAKWGLPILSIVDENGCLTEEAGEFAGLYFKDSEIEIIDRLREEGMLAHSEDFSHTYPHAERDGLPVIYRVTNQWFLSIDHLSLRNRTMEAIRYPEEGGSGGGVSWYPTGGFNRMTAMMRNRPDWCISRQRPWGVGIPIFYGRKSGVPVLDPEAIEAVARLIERRGSDAWFSVEPIDILPEGYAHPITGETEFVKEVDVLDVWFDSGSVSLLVLDGSVNGLWKEHWPADVFFEGSDQHRGWFNSSLVLGMAVGGRPPFRQVVTHGFVVDKDGLKMAKRLGNVIDPVTICDEIGADILRFWAATVDWERDVPCYDELFGQIGEKYRTIRNTLRFLLGNLEDYDEPYNGPLADIDLWLGARVDELAEDCIARYLAYDFSGVANSIHNFCAKELSRFYIDAIKDRMYCEKADSNARRSAQFACHRALVTLTKLVAPILVHTSEEIYQRIPVLQRLRSVHMEHFEGAMEEPKANMNRGALDQRYRLLLDLRAEVFAAFECWASEQGIDPQDVLVRVSLPAAQLEMMREFEQHELANLFKVSWLDLRKGSMSIDFEMSPYDKCERSRLRRPDVKQVNGYMLSERDAKALGWLPSKDFTS